MNDVELKELSLRQINALEEIAVQLGVISNNLLMIAVPPPPMIPPGGWFKSGPALKHQEEKT